MLTKVWQEQNAWLIRRIIVAMFAARFAATWHVKKPKYIYVHVQFSIAHRCNNQLGKQEFVENGHKTKTSTETGRNSNNARFIYSVLPSMRAYW